MCKCGDNMRTANNLIGVDEAESEGIRIRKKFDAMEASTLEAATPSGIHAIAPDPKKFHALRRRSCACNVVDHIRVKDTNHLGIGERVGSALRSERHDVGMGSGIQGILAAPYVVGSIVDAQDFVTIYSIIAKQ
jgi:DNA-binding transcriptional regulator YdaS (Cro superfamily)